MATDRQLIRLALYDAIDWQAGLADAYAHIPNAPEREEALSQVRLYRGLLRRRYGEEKRGNTADVGMKSVVGKRDFNFLSISPP